MPRVNMWEAMPGTADEGGGGGKDERIDDLEAKEKELPFPLASALNKCLSLVKVKLSTRQET